MRALVTGAAGFLGREVIPALLRRGVAVRALVRPAALAPGLGPEVELASADLRGAATDLGPVFDDVDVLVHLAVASGGGEDAQFATSVVGTERLLAAMERSGCRRIVLASSFSVYDWSAIEGELDEESPIEPVPDLYQRDGYSIAKSWQERVVRRAATEQGWDLTVMRPGFIWGRKRAYLAAMGVQVSRFHLVIGPFTRMPMTHVENCADLFALAAVDPRARNQTFNVVDDAGQRIWTFLGEYLRGTGQRGTRIPIPYRATLMVVQLLFGTVFRRNLKLPQILIPCRFESRLKPLRYGAAKARQQLDWTPPLSFAQCLQRTFDS